MTTIDKEYDGISDQYNATVELPIYRMLFASVEHALGDCTGKSVLDLGGGTSIHARQVVDLGATLVDNVDLSRGMLEAGKAISSSLGRNDPIRWIEGDVSKSMEHLGLQESYDVVIVGWTFNHAEDVGQLQGMWRNVSRFTKPGGLLVNTRIANIWSEAAQTGKYGVHYTDISPISGGVSCVYHAHTDPAYRCSATSMTVLSDFRQATKLAEEHGFLEHRKVSAEELQIVKDDPDFWRLYLEDPDWICVTARKAS